MHEETQTAICLGLFQNRNTPKLTPHTEKYAYSNQLQKRRVVCVDLTILHAAIFHPGNVSVFLTVKLFLRSLTLEQFVVYTRSFKYRSIFLRTDIV